MGLPFASLRLGFLRCETAASPNTSLLQAPQGPPLTAHILLLNTPRKDLGERESDVPGCSARVAAVETLHDPCDLKSHPPLALSPTLSPRPPSSSHTRLLAVPGICLVPPQCLCTCCGPSVWDTLPQISPMRLLPSPPSGLFKCHLLRDACLKDPG